MLWIGIFAFSSNDIKVGANIEVDGAPWRVIGELANFTVTCYRISCWGFARIDFYACKLRKNGNSLSGELLFQFSTLSCTFKEVWFLYMYRVIVCFQVSDSAFLFLIPSFRVSSCETWQRSCICKDHIEKLRDRKHHGENFSGWKQG